MTGICALPYGEITETNASHELGVTCSPIHGGALFVFPAAMAIQIYSPDGRLAYSGQLENGQNRIGLGRGIYFWKTGEYHGKVAIR
ncbi:MAG: hypothetical protein ACPL68_04870 [Candidatus Hydrothermia bacterium]